MAVYHFLCRHWLIRDLVTLGCALYVLVRWHFRGDGCVCGNCSYGHTLCRDPPCCSPTALPGKER